MDDTLQILLIDDDDVDRLAVRRALRAAGVKAEVREAKDAGEGLAAMKAGPFDCVLLDYRLPDSDGLSVLREARAAGVKSPVVMLTGQGDEELAVEIMKAGASDYLTKSRMSLDHLVQSVRTAVRLHRAEEQAAAATARVAEMLAQEQAARADAEAAQHRLAFLAEASKLLAASLNYEETLAAVVHLAVPRIADGCAVDMVGPNHCLQRLVVAYADTAKTQLAQKLQSKYPSKRDDPRGVAQVIRSGTPQLYPEIPDQLLVESARDAEHLRLLRELGMRSAMIVPLETRGEVLGAITLIAAESGRRFDSADLALAEDLARRAAIAVDNARLYQRMRQAKDAAIAANTAKDKFLAVLSHELRTPLTPVLATVQRMEADGELSADTQDSLRMVRRNVELEARLIDDLLDLTRISRGKLQLTFGTVDVHDLLGSVLEICQGEIAAKRQKVQVRLSAATHHARADSARLQQILWNLIKNAVKFTPAGGRITVATSNDANGNLEVRVVDTGIGIEPELLPRIFDAFEQGEQAMTRQFGGLGLGLAISRTLVEGHGGSISAQSQGKGSGATFMLRLPTTAASAALPRPPATIAPCQAVGNLRILLVDDHEDTSRAMKRLLERVGYEVRTASSVAGALESANRNPFDVLISDIGLPDGSGLDLLRQLKESYNHGLPLKAIALSGFGMEEDLQKSRDAGFVEHLTKPVNFQQLEAVIQQLTAG